MTRVASFKEWIENHRYFSVLIIIGIIVIALGAFTDALDKIHKFLATAPTKSAAREPSPQPQPSNSDDWNESPKWVDARDAIDGGHMTKQI